MGKPKCFGHATSFENAVQIEFDHRIKCAWETFTSHRQSPKDPLRDTLKFFDATGTPSLLHAKVTSTVTEDVKKKLRTTHRRMMRMIIQTKENKHMSSSRARLERRRGRQRRTQLPRFQLGGKKQPRRRQQPLFRRNLRRQSRRRAEIMRGLRNKSNAQSGRLVGRITSWILRQGVTYWRQGG